MIKKKTNIIEKSFYFDINQIESIQSNVVKLFISYLIFLIFELQFVYVKV